MISGKRRFLKYFLILIGLISVYLLLMIPGPDPAVPKIDSSRAFAWNQDRRWKELETLFQRARATGCIGLQSAIDSNLAYGSLLVDTLRNAIDAEMAVSPDDQILNRLENNTFETAALVAACPDKISSFIEYISELRIAIKRLSQNWDVNSPIVRRRIYRLLYGARAAIEETMLQAPPGSYQPLIMGENEQSLTPSATVLGVKIHSGDILISRGGVATSSLIARGNDFPGNFSHAALVFVDSQTSLISVIESHIEKGMTISSLDDYFKDKKLRIMILRLRSDLPEVIKDPLLPDKAARQAIADFNSGHIAYDFAMDLGEHRKRFCSEVVSAPYSQFGINLWAGESNISTPGTVCWLAMFGVKQFETEAPSDLEYDPQVQVVAEWRDPETLYKDHIDNAVTDIMLEDADKGEPLRYQVYMLPVARIAKLYSAFLNRIAKVGPIPEGMDAKAALRNMYFTNRHSEIADSTYRLAGRFKKDNGYTPPYWELVKLARQAKEQVYK